MRGTSPSGVGCAVVAGSGLIVANPLRAPAPQAAGGT